MHADGVDATDAVDLDHETLEARHHGPDVHEGQDGKVNAPDQCQRDADQHRQQPVAPVLGDGESSEARLPHTVKTVGPCRLGDHVLKVHLWKIRTKSEWMPSRSTWTNRSRPVSKLEVQLVSSEFQSSLEAGT